VGGLVAHPAGDVQVVDLCSPYVGRDKRVVLVVAVVTLVGDNPVECLGDRCEYVAVVRGRDDDSLGEVLAVGRLDDEPCLVGTNGLTRSSWTVAPSWTACARPRSRNRSGLRPPGKPR